jgi:hypothetical protein
MDPHRHWRLVPLLLTVVIACGGSAAVLAEAAHSPRHGRVAHRRGIDRARGRERVRRACKGSPGLAAHRLRSTHGKRSSARASHRTERSRRRRARPACTNGPRTRQHRHPRATAATSLSGVTKTTEATQPSGPAGTPAPLSAEGEAFAEAPSDVLLTYPENVVPADATQCVGVKPTGESEAFGNVAQGPTENTLRLYLVPGGAMPAKVQCSVSGGGSVELSVAAAAPAPGGVVSDPIDERYLTEVPFGLRSYWIQPWRAYMDTWPASRLTGALGINFNVSPTQAEDVAQLVQESGFKLARVEIGWNSLSYSDPTQFANEADIDTLLEALKRHGLRPLILLNANSGQPAPAQAVTLETTAEAAAGATTVDLTAASAAQVVPGKTGFNDLSFGGGPDILITSLNAGNEATLSRPLLNALPVGAHAGTTLLYAPFGPPELVGGAPNPAFDATLTGWLSYVATICKKAAAIFGPEGYDLEIWNELTFGSQFLDEENYYSPPRETGEGSVEETIRNQTVAYVRNPANGISPQVGITNGFASETPFAAGSIQPVGMTAISKHPYASFKYFPADEEDNGNRPINALGEQDYVETESGSYMYPFNPSFMQELPEYYLTATQTETLIRDVAPFTTSIYGVPHGRVTAPEGGIPPQVWVTEYNLNDSYLPAVNPEDPERWEGEADPEQAAHIQAEIELRSLVSDVAKGIAREYFYAATGSGWGLISEGFLNAVSSDPSVYPGSALGGETMASLGRLIAYFQGPGPGESARQLSLLSIAQEGNHYQFAGNGTEAFPDLYDRDVLAVFPFQSSPTRFVIPVYVMTENLTAVYNASEPEGSPTRFDMPSENFRITLGNLPETPNPPAVGAYDPLTNESTPARFISRKGSTAVFEIAATNYPRLLTLEYE